MSQNILLSFPISVFDFSNLFGTIHLSKKWLNGVSELHLKLGKRLFILKKGFLISMKIAYHSPPTYKVASTEGDDYFESINYLKSLRNNNARQFVSNLFSLVKCSSVVNRKVSPSLRFFFFFFNS